MATRITASLPELTGLERELLALLRRRPRSTAELAALYWPRQPPFNGANILRGRLTGIERKLAARGEKRAVMKSPRRGPHPINYWIEKRGSGL